MSFPQMLFGKDFSRTNIEKVCLPAPWAYSIAKIELILQDFCAKKIRKGTNFNRR